MLNSTQRKLCATVVFSMLFFFGSSAHAADVTVSPSTITVSPGSSVTVSVVVSNVSALFGAAFDVLFNPQILSFVSAQKGTFLEQGGTTNVLSTVSPAGNLIVGYSILGASAGVSGSGTLMTLTFNALAAGTSALNFQNNALCSTGSSSGCAMITPTTWNAGTIVVSSGTDTTAPTTPTILSVTAISFSQINLAWTASTDNIGVTGYRIYRNGAQIATSLTTSYSNTSLSPSTAYTYTIAAYDAAGNVSVQSTSASATTLSAVDTTTPTTPLGLTATGVSSSQINLSWTVSTDNVGVAGYRIYRNGAQIATSLTTSYSNTSLSPSTAYTYTIAAYDAAGNASTQSASASGATLAATVTTTTSTSATGGGSTTPLSTSIPATTQIISPNISATSSVSGVVSSTLATPSTPTSISISSLTLTRTLYRGIRGTDVTSLQTFLIQKGHLAPTNATGFYGPITMQAVQKYQCAQSIVCSGNEATTGYGVVGAKTRAKLNAGSTASGVSSSTTNLTNAQVDAILSVLQSFGAEQAIIDQVRRALGR